MESEEKEKERNNRDVKAVAHWKGVGGGGNLPPSNVTFLDRN